MDKLIDEQFLHERLQKREDAGNLRKLPEERRLVDFVSNDYLGLAQNSLLAERVHKRFAQMKNVALGATGSRLLSGNHHFYAELEHSLAEIFQTEAVLVCNSGYAANQAVVSAVAEKGDTILYDQLSHVCLKEGAWLSGAETVVFRHNDLDDLEQKLQRAQGRKFVLTETIFSMDGDLAPVEEIVILCEKYDAYLIIDEAHSTGVIGAHGAGFCVKQALQDRIFARVYTFGKAMGAHGAIVAGSQLLKDYLVNFGRSFIYTTALPPHSIVAIQESFRFLSEHEFLQKKLMYKIALFRSLFPDSVSQSAIQPVMAGSNEKARAWSAYLMEKGFDVRPILSPTVRRGTERLRISLHVHNTDEEIVLLVDLIRGLMSA